MKKKGRESSPVRTSSSVRTITTKPKKQTTVRGGMDLKGLSDSLTQRAQS